MAPSQMDTKAFWPDSEYPAFCDFCGSHPAGLLCTKCRSARYCSRCCQRQSWVAGHRQCCVFRSRLATFEHQRRRGDVALAVSGLEDIVREIGRKATSESVRQAADKSAIIALLVVFAAVVGDIAHALCCGRIVGEHAVRPSKVEPSVVGLPLEAFCRAAFRLTSVFLDVTAVLKKAGQLPALLEPHVLRLTESVSELTPKDADPVLSSWMLYDAYAKGLEDRLSKYEAKLPRLRVSAVLALRDVMAASYDLLLHGSNENCTVGSSPSLVGAREKWLAKRVDDLLDHPQLQVNLCDLRALRPYQGGDREALRLARTLPHGRRHDSPPPSSDEESALVATLAAKTRGRTAISERTVEDWPPQAAPQRLVLLSELD